MARDKLTEYSATASENTVCGDVNIAENSALPSDMNNYAREIMTHLKNFSDGTDAITGLTVAGNVSVDGGTIKLDGNYPTGSHNVAMGDGAFDSVTTGADNVAIGHLAATALTEGNYNVVVGDTALVANTTGEGNTALGREALKANTTADNNTAVGRNALSANTTGSGNVAMGNYTMDAVTTGTNSTAVGYQSLSAQTTASNNTAFGFQALTANTSGTPNVAVGGYALDANTTGPRNTAMGYDAAGATTTGADNVAIGYQALNTNTVQNGNTVVGGKAGFSTTSTLNTFMGESSGYFVSSGQKNTILGRYNGNQDGLDIRTSSNNVVLSDGDGNVCLRATNSQSVVIPGFGASGGKTPQASSSLAVFKDGATTRVLHSENLNNTSGDENHRSFLGSNCNNTSSYHFIASISGGGDKLYMYGNGNIQNTNNSYGGLSDIKLKENISDASSQWDDIKAVQVKKYSWIADDLNAADQIGVIAQDLEASGMSGLVETTDDKDEDGALTGTQTKGVKYSILYMKAVKALQEAMTRIETLETKVAALEAN